MSASKKTNKRRRVYIPTFEGAIEGWLHNFLTKNLWRVERTKDRNDCMQEAYCVFLHVAETYPHVDDAPHFMALFKTSWERVFHDFSSVDSAVRSGELIDDGRPQIEEPIGDMANEGELRVMLRQAPREVQMVLNLMLRAPQEMLDIALAGFFPRDKRTHNGISAKASARINAMLGLPLEMNTLERVREYFQP